MNTYNETIQDMATPALQQVAAAMKHPKPLLTVVGRRVHNELKAHFIERDSEGNSKGWWRSHFWAKTVARATHFVGATDNEATVAISSPEFQQKLHGGTITAKSGKMLAIPLTSAAKAAGSPRENNLKLFIVKTASQVFLARLTGSGKKAAHGIEFLYILKHSVTQQADRRALPDPYRLSRAIDEEAVGFLKDVL